MVTKATRDVLDMTIRNVTDFVLDGTGTSSIDSTPIGVTTPDVGNFSSSSITALTTATTANFSTAVMSGGTWGYPVATAGQITALTSTQQVLVELADNSLVQVDINDLPTNNAVPDASLAVPVSDNGFVMSSDGTLMYNNSGAAITPTTGLTAANLITDGYTPVSSSLLPADAVGFLANDGAGALAWSQVLTDASLAAPIQDNALVMSSDGVVHFNNSGAAITPTTGLTAANLVTDGFTSMAGAQYIETAGVAVATATYDGGAIWYDTTNEIIYTLIEQGGAKTWVDIGGAGGGDKLIADASLVLSIPDNVLVLSSDGSILINNSGAVITPTTGLTAANLVTDGFTAVGGGTAATTTLAGLVELATAAEAAAGTDNTRYITPLQLAVATAGGGGASLVTPVNFWNVATVSSGVTTAPASPTGNTGFWVIYNGAESSGSGATFSTVVSASFSRNTSGVITGALSPGDTLTIPGLMSVGSLNFIAMWHE